MALEASTSDLTRAQRRCGLAIMAKAPVSGQVKTRLVPQLTRDEAATLSACFLRDTATNIATVGSRYEAEGVVMYTPVDAGYLFNGLVPADFQLIAQRGLSLGERLLNATTDLLARNYHSICLINSDSPTLPPTILAAAVQALAPAGDRVVLGAAEDGGYYLIGLKRAHEKIFERIAWSTSQVLAHTLERVRQLSLETVMLPTWYDVDDAATLDRLCHDLFVTQSPANHGHPPYAAPHTRDYLARLIKTGGRDRIWRHAVAESDAE